MELGRFGVWTSFRQIGEEQAGAAAALVEELGFGTFWLGGSPQPQAVRPLLAATSQLVAATGIVNVWASDPADVAAQNAELAETFPDRFMMGIGIGHPEATSDYKRPLQAMTAFLDGLDQAPTPMPVQQRCLAALGPKMLDLAHERSRGTHTYFVSVEHTRWARQRLGAGPLIATELACVVDEDAARARDTARGYARMYLGLRNYTNNLLRHGFTEDDIGDGGSDRLIDAVIPHGRPEDIASAAAQHLEAGADHVCFQPLGEDGIPRAAWTALASALNL
jgi:probable F420-dependent oxidoreductase